MYIYLTGDDEVKTCNCNISGYSEAIGKIFSLNSAPDSLLIYSQFQSFILDLPKTDMKQAKMIHADYLHNG